MQKLTKTVTYITMRACELRLRHCSMGLKQERAAEEPGLSFPTFKRMEPKREGRLPATCRICHGDADAQNHAGRAVPDEQNAG